MAKPKTKVKKTNPADKYGTYLWKIHKKLNSELSLSRESLATANGIVVDFLERMIERSCKEAALDGKTTLSAKHGQTALQGLLTGQLREYGYQQASKAVTKYVAAVEAA